MMEADGMGSNPNGGQNTDSGANSPTFGGPDGSEYRNPRLRELWPKLHLDEKRYLRCRPLLKTDTEAAKFIGQTQNWIKQKKSVEGRRVFREAIGLRDSWDDDEVGRLLNEDLLALAQVEIAGLTQGLINGDEGKASDIFKVTSAINTLERRAEGKASNNGTSSSKRGYVLSEEVTTWKDDWGRRAEGSGAGKTAI